VRFRTRLLVRYSLLVFFLVVVLGVVFYLYTTQLFEDNAARTYRLLSTRMALHLDNLVRPMDFITENLISDSAFRSNIITLATLDRSKPQNASYINEAEQTVRSDLLTYSIQKSFYSVVVVTRKGDFFSSNFENHGQMTHDPRPFSDYPGYAAADAAGGRAVVVSPHNDPWDANERTQQYGLARVIPGEGGNLALIEVQNPVTDLESLFDVPDPNYVRIYAIHDDRSPFYESRATSPAVISSFLAMTHTGAQDGFERDPLTGKSVLVIASRSSYTGITVLLVLSRNVLLRPLAFVGWTTVGVAVLIILVSFLYTWFSSARLTEPLRLIRRRMEATELSNLPGHVTIEHDNDEIVALDRSFKRLRARLDEAIKRELRFRTLSLKSRLDSLQAQMNPHFLYNVLTVIAGKGLELGSEEIGDICDAIAAMLRYSTSTSIRSATLAEEIEHLQSYLFLMKTRLEDRLECEFDVDEEILDITMPKIVLQQIVENSITHGYRDRTGPIRIQVRGYRIGDEWTVELSDDGRGFDQLVLERLEAKMHEFNLRPAGRDEEMGLQIGGLGLMNTYMRMHLFYRGLFEWKILNRPEGGARVTIGARVARPIEETGDVQRGSC